MLGKKRDKYITDGIIIVRYAVVECPICGRYLALDLKVGYRKCPYCGYVNKLETSRVIKRFRSPKEASELVRILNEGKEEFKPMG